MSRTGNNPRAVATAGMEPSTAKRTNLQHASRMDAGAAHYRRDVGRAPWEEDRVPGTSYGTIRYPDGAR